MRQVSDIDLLMIGKTGNGKSALGNALLKRKVFISKSSARSVTTEIGYEVSDYKGKIIKVVDGPGVGDTRMNTTESVKLVVKAMEQAMVVNTRGYHAFLLVVRFGGRFTAEDQDTIRFLKQVFGPEFVRRFCILVMTCGDNFEHVAEEDGITFSQWCHAQTGVFQELLRECGDRIVLFDNVTKDESKRDAQIDELLRVVASLQHQGLRYTDHNFEQAKTAREKAIVESKKPEIREEIFQETSLILQKLEEIRSKSQGEEKISLLQELLTRCDELLKQLHDQDKGTGVLHDVEKSMTNTRQSVSEVIRVETTVAEERSRMDQREQEMRANMEREMQQQRQHFEALMQEQKRSEEERREMERELERKRQQLEDERRQEREAREQQLIQQLDNERKLMEQQRLQLQKAYSETKKKSRRGFWGKLVGFIGDIFS